MIKQAKYPTKHLAFILAGTVCILFVPFIANLLDTSVNWGLEDFVAAGLMLLSLGIFIDLIIYKVRQNNYRFLMVAAALLIFVYIWAELAVGIFTNIGS